MHNNPLSSSTLHVQIDLIHLLPNNKFKDECIDPNKKDIFLNFLINRQSLQSHQLVLKGNKIAQIDSLIKPILYQGTVTLAQQKIKFSINTQDKLARQKLFLTIYSVKSAKSTKVTEFQFPIKKYIEGYRKEENYCQEKLIDQFGNKLEVQVFVEKNLAALFSLVSKINSEKRKIRSESAKKARKYSPFNKTKNFIQGFNKEDKQTQKNRQMQPPKTNKSIKHSNVKHKQNKYQQQQQSSFQKYKLRKQKSQPSFQQLIQHHTEVPEQVVHNKIKQCSVQPQQELSTSIQSKNISDILNKNKKRQNLEISKITQILNSEQYTQMDKDAVLEGFQKIAKSQKSSQGSFPFTQPKIKMQSNRQTNIENSHKTNIVGELSISKNKNIYSKKRSQCNTISIDRDINRLSYGFQSQNDLPVKSCGSDNDSWSEISKQSQHYVSDGQTSKHSSQISARQDAKKNSEIKLKAFVIILIIVLVIVASHIYEPAELKLKGKMKKNKKK